MSTENRTIKVSNTADLRTAIDAGYTRDQIEVSVPDHAAEIAAARAEGLAEGSAKSNDEVSAAAAKSERERIAKIHGIGAKGFEKEIEAAITNGTSAADTALQIMTLARERGVTIGALAADATRTTHAAAPGNGANVTPFAKTIAKANKGAK